MKKYNSVVREIKPILFVAMFAFVLAMVTGCAGSGNKNSEEEAQEGEVATVVERVTAQEIEESINNTTDGMVPESISSRFSLDKQTVVVQNDPDTTDYEFCYYTFAEVWLDKAMGNIATVTVVECTYDENNKLETLTIVVNK